MIQRVRAPVPSAEESELSKVKLRSHLIGCVFGACHINISVCLELFRAMDWYGWLCSWLCGPDATTDSTTDSTRHAEESEDSKESKVKSELGCMILRNSMKEVKLEAADVGLLLLRASWRMAEADGPFDENHCDRPEALTGDKDQEGAPKTPRTPMTCSTAPSSPDLKVEQILTGRPHLDEKQICVQQERMHLFQKTMRKWVLLRSRLRGWIFIKFEKALVARWNQRRDQEKGLSASQLSCLELDAQKLLEPIRRVTVPEERRRMFLALCKEWHPDRNLHRQQVATKMFQFLQEGKMLMDRRG
eukprot:s2099_g2.t1